MLVKMEVETDNAAFTDDRGAEVARIIREALPKIERGERSITLRDANGNTVGTIWYEDE